MYQFEKIKLIIWDLDETFWHGTLSEGAITIPPHHKELIKTLTDIGIINSICSKNDWQQVRAVLEQHALSEFFVFPSVNWEPKGGRIQKMIADMQLRAENVLFIDDNPSNRGEVEYACKEIMIAAPEDILKLGEEAACAEKRDLQHARLKQYQLLEAKHMERTHSASNEAFLMGSNIRLEILHDCKEQLERIHDLLMRSNQLNFTKVRSSREELLKILENPFISCGYVTVKDRFGDYGVVGFYALRDNKLIHFLFSCRTLGMGIEQYVFNYLGRPELSITGEVISDLSAKELPKWINQEMGGNGATAKQMQNVQDHQILIKGPCDLYQIFPYIANRQKIDTDFTHVTARGVPLESTSHTTHIVEALRLSDSQKKLVADEVPFADVEMYDDAIYHAGYKVVVLSILSDANLGVYRRKKTGERLAFLEYNHPLTDSANWKGIISGEYYNAGLCFDEQLLKAFSEKYEFIGRNTPERIVENLSYIRSNLPEDCLMIVMLGGELYYEKNTIPAYCDRHLVHQQINGQIRKWAATVSKVQLLDVNRYIVDQNSFYDHFNHYTKPVYYELACELVEYINAHLDVKMRNTAKAKIVFMRMKEILAPAYHKMRALINK